MYIIGLIERYSMNHKTSSNLLVVSGVSIDYIRYSSTTVTNSAFCFINYGEDLPAATVLLHVGVKVCSVCLGNYNNIQMDVILK